MQAPQNFVRVVDKKRYSTETATLIADNVYWDGNNTERNGTNLFLYKTAKGAFFTVFLTQWQGARNRLEPISTEDAYQLYECHLIEHHVLVEEAFPDIVLTDA